MTDYSYTREIQSAQRMIAKKGVSSNMVRAGVSYPCKALITQWSTIERLNSLIQWTDRKILIAAADLPFSPDPEQDQLVIGTDPPLRIVNNDPIAPGNIPIVHQLQCRR